MAFTDIDVNTIEITEEDVTLSFVSDRILTPEEQRRIGLELDRCRERIAMTILKDPPEAKIADNTAGSDRLMGYTDDPGSDKPRGREPGEGSYGMG